MEQQNTVNDWRNNLQDIKSNNLKLKDGDIVIGFFKDEGKEIKHNEYGTSIVFQFLVEGEEEVKNFYVKANNFDLLNQLKALGTLTNLKVKLTRVGSKRSDTRYKVIKI